ncbi:cyclic nucleotide-binding domain-containing protein [Terrisporobacter vanillatitrophus]
MIILNDKIKLSYYISKFQINGIFTKNIEKYMELHYFKKGSHICVKGDRLDYFYFFVKGRAKVYISTPNGKSLLIRFYSPLQVIGDVEVTCNENADCNIQAIEDCLCVGVPLHIVHEISTYDPKFLSFVCKHLSSKLTSTSASTSLNVLYPLENRLASYLLALYPNDLTPEDKIVTDNFTQLSELLGSDYRHFLRVVDKLCSKNIIKKEKRSLVIVDRVALNNLAVDLYN